MAMLPVGFGMMVFSTQPRLLTNMVESDIGRAIIMMAIVFELIGGFLIWKISTFKEF